jgi:hypothetical protein
MIGINPSFSAKSASYFFLICNILFVQLLIIPDIHKRTPCKKNYIFLKKNLVIKIIYYIWRRK